MSIKDTITSAWDTVTTTIANGASLSESINLGGLRVFGFVMPSAWTSAGITFQTSYDGGTTWVDVYDSLGTELSVTVSTSRFVYIDPAVFAAVPILKIRSGTSGTPVNQGGDRSISLVLRGV